MSQAKLLLIALAAASAIAVAPPAPLALELDVKGGGSSQAVLRVGFATVRIVFDSEHLCPDPDSCSAPGTLGAPVAALARGLLKL
ncbi:hypothetical protein [Sphingomonas sp. S2-65]|uniref:hypothetical protein n=1 Tax=Sphingomonas sp. S2-65 TaxID=2903960 RepID=UPI001F364F33|nr:hypothetical protein [Sphingomonas sp. S2-65]UYY57877.1 hypothetical protein LZ586_14595 [Sphingomonas sp. S2-65]